MRDACLNIMFKRIQHKQHTSMPPEISDTKRSQIIFYSALGYTQREIGEEVDVSRNTIRKYRQKTREIIESANNPEKTLAAIIENRYDWERSKRQIISFGEHPM